ncbi:MAG TPA: metalloregulator ArsR/SmtB family transcription factor [Steroidobacteraceae bacterium]|jgi:DNA-binding transcriptional ArsR family regulator|nr:metalloregulator ArsR/SmtB family transcription factor [Steroidobacteraceae bacterium]
MVPAAVQRSSVRATSVAPIFAALGDPTRLKMLQRLGREGPQNITSLAAKVDITHQAVSKHLRVLESAQLISSTRDGRDRVWAIETDSMKDLHAFLDEISGQWDNALKALRKMVEE